MRVHSAQEYLETQVLTASPHRLHLLVLDGAVRFARQAILALEEENWELLDRTLSRSRDCVSELIGGLDDEVASDAVESTKALFAFAFRSLALADPERNVQHIHNAIRVLELHRETWVELGLHLTHETNDVPAPHSRSWTT